ncbi:MAG: type II toxin-antitoxin system RelE/ParE family toxin [Cytophagaceae bacterium]
MAKQIIWSLRADKDRIKNFEYWNSRNKSSTFSKKLNSLFNKAVELLANHYSIGKPTEIQNVKIKVVRDYLIIYEDTPELLIILTIWDSRRNPEQLKKIIKKE